jgi:branched-chain amino acid transport system substrate-binding protein
MDPYGRKRNDGGWGERWNSTPILSKNTYEERSRNMRAKLMFQSALSALFVLCLAAGVLAAPAAPQTIPVGVVISLSGFDSNMGNQGKAGYEIGAEDVNRAGGVFVKELGKKIPLELIISDMESDRAKAISRMEWAASTKKVTAYVGMTIINAGQGVAEKNKIPALVISSPIQAAHERGLRYWFSPFGKSPDIARVLLGALDGIPDKKGPKTVAVFQENSEYGTEQGEWFAKEATKRGYKVLFHDKYNPMSKDMSPLILGAKNSGAELVLSCPVTPDGMLMMRQMKELDYNPKAIVMIRAAQDLSWGKAMGPIGEYLMFTGFWHNRVKYPGVDKLNASYQSKYGRPTDPDAGPAYASIQILAAAIERAGSLDKTKIRDAIAATDLMTVMGKVKFRENGSIIDPCPAVAQWQGGSQRLVSPDEFKETSLVYPIPPWKERVK